MVTALTLAAMNPGRLPTFPEILGDWATRTPDRRAYVYLGDGEREESALSFAELHVAAMAVANRLTSFAQPGDRVLLFYPSGLDFIVAFLGCLCAGVVAVPVSVPNRKRGLEIVAGVARDSGAVAILSVSQLLARYGEDFTSEPSLAQLLRFDTENWSRERPNSAPVSQPKPAALALLQYTSGSTGNPRGVIVTHANLAANHRQLQACFRTHEQSVIVSWLPMFHDMGLGTVLQGLWVGAPCVLMSPTAFLQKPVRWLKAISAYRGTHSVAPDFAYELCARTITPAECVDLDLSSWRAACNGSEPVRSASLKRFQATFAKYQLAWQSLHPLYGLAEATLFVSGEALSTGPKVSGFSRSGLEQGDARTDASENGQPLVSCGKAWLDGSVLIVDEEALTECRENRIGEIWVGGPHVAAGYWGKDVESRETFQAFTADGKGPFLRTGDLGFVHAGGLYVTGRSKDLIIVRGRNHYPQDIEDTVSTCHPALEPQRCAAFSVETDDGEGLVVAQEVKRSALRSLDASDVFRAIRNSVADKHGLAAAAIVLLRPLALPRTTSGKVRRKACRDGFLKGTLSEVSSSGFVGAALDPPVRQTVPPAPSTSPSAVRLVQWLRQYAQVPEGAAIARRSLEPAALAEFARQGLLGMQVGAEYGGLALRHGDTARVLEQLGGVDLGASLFVGLNNYLGVWPILRHGQAGLQQELLPQLATGQRLAGFALAEPGADAGMEGWHSHADQVNGSGWRLYGRKFVTGGAPDSGYLNVFLRHKDRPGVSAFVVPRAAEGVVATRVSEDGVARDSVSLQDVFVGHHQVLGQVSQGSEVAFDAIRHSHLAIGAACLGGMKRCSQLIFQHATQRQIGEAGLVAHPVTMTRLGRITAEVTALECLVRLLADLADEGRKIASEAFTVCKLVGPEMVWQAVDDLVQLLGRRGLVETLQVRQLVDDARTLRGLEGPLEAGSALLGAELLGGDLAPLRSLQAEVFAGIDLEPLINQAASALRDAAQLAVGGPPASSHWLDARAGELTTWIILLGAVERKRLAASSADLERTATWIRSNLDSALLLTRSGPPPEVRLGSGVVGDAIASYDRSLARFEAGGPAERRTQIRGDVRGRTLRAWAVSWLAERLRVDEAQIDPQRSFADHGVDSLAAVEFAKALADRVGISLDETLLWNFPTIDSLLGYLENPSATRGSAAPAASTQAAVAKAAVPKAAVPAPDSNLDDEIARLERELKKRS
jgi:acyl-CoA synthetase (AMP-forming)/AMP-acid ligase II/alkylation response protein AidB-like acyl-CoA dehydrogenase/acyl carrier protein